MNHYPRHLGDVLSATIGLTLMERGAYTALLDQYYAREAPLPTDRREVYRLAAAISAPERKAVDYVLSRYFTQEPDGLDFIDADALKTTDVTMKSVVVMDEVQERSWQAVLDVALPLFAITATGDRIVDNQKVRGYLGPQLQLPGNRLAEIDTGHAAQFERPDELAAALLAFIREHGARG